jgi:hypothetical protein
MNFSIQPDVYANKVLQYSSNGSPQLQAQNGQYQTPTIQHNATQRHQHMQASDDSYNPQLALFTFEKGKHAESWADVEAEQQHVAVQDLQSELTKFRRNKGSVKREMEKIPSANCRRLINELVENQNQQLFTRNKSLQWTNAMVDIDWKPINRRAQRIKRVSVILQTEPSGFNGPQSQKAGAGSHAQIQIKSDAMNFPSQPHSQNPNMGQTMRNNLHQGPPNAGSMQPLDQPLRMPPDMHHGAGPPPPPGRIGNMPPPAHVGLPPPPPGAIGGPPLPPPGMMGGHPPPQPPPPPPHFANAPPPPPPHFANAPLPMSMGPPPPPPGAYPPHGVLKGSQPSNQRPPPHHQKPPQPRVMPGAFPRPTSGHGHQQVVEIVDPYVVKGQKRHKLRREESASETDSDEWVDSESGSSGSDRFRVHAVERSEYDLVDRRGRRSTTRSQKAGRHSSHSRVRSRSRSRSRSQARRSRHAQQEPYRRRRDSGPIDPPPMGRHSSSSAVQRTTNTSPQLPPIHIHMMASAKERRHGSRPGSSQAMSREHSWDRDSGTASFHDDSSVHTADDSVFSEPVRPIRTQQQRRRPSRAPSDVATNLRSRNLPPRQHSAHGYPHGSHGYDDDAAALRRQRNTRLADDYPHIREQPHMDASVPPFGSRPAPHRRNTTQTQLNPFETARFPPQARAMSYGAGAGVGMGMGVGMHDPRFPEHEHNHGHGHNHSHHLHFDGFHDELERIREREEPRKPLYRRSVVEHRRGGEACCLPEARVGGGCGGGYTGFGGRW